MALHSFLWRLATLLLMSIFSLSIVVLNDGVVEAYLIVTPLCNVTNNKTDAESCSLDMHDAWTGEITFFGSPFQTCRVQLETSNETAAMIQIPRGALVFAERREDTRECQKKYASFITDEPCMYVARYPKIHLFLEGDSTTGSKIIISQMRVNTSAPICSNGTGSGWQHIPRVSQTNYCQSNDFEDMISCDLSPDQTCSLKFPANCNTTLIRQHVEFQCHNDNSNSYLRALVAYPTGVITLDLARQDIVAIKKCPFKTLISLKRLILTENRLSNLSSDVFTNLTSLKMISLTGNFLKSLPVGLFQYLSNLTELFLDKNHLTTLHTNLLKGLHKLKVLNVARNEIKVIPKHLLHDLLSLNKLYLNYNNLSTLPRELLNSLRNLTRFYVSHNELKVLPISIFRNLKRLNNLGLSYNKIDALDENALNETIKLKKLWFRYNSLKHLSGKVFNALQDLVYLNLCGNKLLALPYDLFWGLNKLEMLCLGSNKIQFIHFEAFIDLKSLQKLYLSDNCMKSLGPNLFKDTYHLNILDLSMNSLNDIPNISHLSQLVFLDLKGNKMEEVSKQSFSGIPHKTEMVVSQHEICECYVSAEITCTAGDDRSPYLTCDRLMSDRVLLTAMWLIGLNAIVGNVFVLSQKQTQTERNKVQTFLLRNLAISDLLMGVYMLLIASADIYFGEQFPMQAEAWRVGVTCRIAGTISILSSEASVFFVTLISIDRFICIKYPFSSRKIGKISSALITSLLWIISLALGIVPSILAGKSDTFYDNSHVCIGLPLTKLQIYENHQSEDWVSICSDEDVCFWKQPVKSEIVAEINGMIFASVLFLGLNLICYLFIVVCYVEIVRAVVKSSQRVGLNREMTQQIRLTIKVAAIVLTDFLCWFPIIILGILVQAGVLTLSSSVFAWCVTFVLPINSAINPYLYTISAIVGNRLKQVKATRQQNKNQSSISKDKTDNTIHTKDIEMAVITSEEP